MSNSQRCRQSAPTKKYSLNYHAFLVAFIVLPVTPSFSSTTEQEIPLEAILGSKQAFLEWKAPFEKWYVNQINSIAGFTPSNHKILKKEDIDDVTLVTIQFEYPAGTPLFGKVGGGVLALPKKIDKKLPIIVAIHGHEENSWGQFPIGLFYKKQWPWKIAKKGYVVWAPVSMYHEEIKSLGDTKGYLVSWVKIISDGINYSQNIIWQKPRAGYAAIGLSAGGTIGFSLMAYRSDVSVGIFAGADQDLDFLRREYRIQGHPNCWDVNGISSYTPIQSLIAPRPVQFQLGKHDPFYPDHTPFEKQGNWFSGTSRDVLATETGGNALVIKSIYDMYNNAGNFSYLIHSGGHEMDSDAALRFLKKHHSNTGIKR